MNSNVTALHAAKAPSAIRKFCVKWQGREYSIPPSKWLNAVEDVEKVGPLDHVAFPGRGKRVGFSALCRGSGCELQRGLHLRYQLQKENQIFTRLIRPFELDPDQRVLMVLASNCLEVIDCFNDLKWD